MEAFMLRRSNITADRSSSHRLREGNKQVQKQRNFPKLASDSSSESSDTTDKDSFTCELRQRTSKQAGGTPIKKLLAEEMSRETESKRRSPNVIARLMGLDGLPAQQPSHKQQKRYPGKYLQRIVSPEKVQRNGLSYGNWSSRKSSEEEQEFKDVYEVSDTSKIESSRYSQLGVADSKLTKSEMAFIHQKFKDAKCPSTDVELQDSKEFHDAIEDPDSNTDLLVKFLQQPDSLFAMHLHGLQGAPPQSHCGHISAMKSSCPPEDETNGLGRKVEKKAPCKDWRKPHDDPFSHPCSKHAAHSPVRTSTVQLDRKHESTVLPTRIVVLKPNLGKVQNATRTVSSPRASYDFLSDCRKDTELTSVKNGEAESCGKKKIYNDAGPSRCKSRESREIAKEITRQMRSTLSSGSAKFSTAGFRGYAGDESSSYMSENESTSESEVTTVTSRNSIDWNNRFRSSSSRSTESSVSREARKRLSERWKMTHKSLDMGEVSRGSTLGEMLAVPDREVRPANSEAMVGGKGCSGRSDANDGLVGLVEPLGISSRDGWKDGCTRNLSGSKSVPVASIGSISSKTGMRRETLCIDRYVMPKEIMQRERNKALKGNVNQREGSCSRNSRSSCKRSHISHFSCSDYSDTSPEIHFSQNQAHSNITKDDLFEQNHMVSETSTTTLADRSLVPENVVNLATENAAIPCKPTEPDLSTYMLEKGNTSAGNLEFLSSQESSNGPTEKGSVAMQQPVAELESPARSKEADQPSPISVLETPFPDDLSSGSECFESLSADLHGLRMQLQLLKLESEPYAEGPMLISSDEDAEQGSVGFSEERRMIEESWEACYVVDLLLKSGISDADPDTFMATLHSPECPVNPLVFEELEKKYCNCASWPRSERRLLFDRINSALLVIYQQFADPHLWLRPATRIVPKWIKNGLEDSLHKLLASQEKKANKDAAEKVLATELQWLDLGDDIDVIGRETERMLMQELVKELIEM